MLESRIINSSLREDRLRRIVTPQILVLSPLLWQLSVNVILRQFKNRISEIEAYVDDVVILISGKFLSTITNVIQIALTQSSVWAVEKGLGENPVKTERVLFTKKV